MLRDTQHYVAVLELSKESWLVAGIVPGVERQPLKKLAADENELLKLLERWRAEAEKAGHKIDRITVAFEAGRAIPTFAEEDAKRPHRERETLVGEQTTIINRIKATLARLGIRSFNPKLKKAAERLEHLRTPEGVPIPPNTLAELRRDMARKQLVAEQIKQIEKARLEQLKQAPKDRPNLMVLLLVRVIGIGIETADMLVKEILSRNLRDRRAVARYGGLTGSPDESGKTRREKGLARAGNARVRRGMIQLAWRFLEFQKESALANWIEARTKNGSRKKMIVALARKLLIALWRFVCDGVVPEGVVLRPAH